MTTPSEAIALGDRERLGRGGLKERLERRAAIFRAVRAFFEGRGYLEIDAPAAVPCPGLDLHLDAFAIDGGVRGRPMYLSTSPEYQLKRLVAGGLERVFAIAHCFRNGELGRRHNPEFTMCEWYRAACGYLALMDETEELVRLVATELGDGTLSCDRDLRIDARAPFLRLTVAEAFERFAGASREEVSRLAERDEDSYFRLLVERVEPGLRGLGVPAFLYDFPASQASLARCSPSEREVCERFELYVGDLELCNGFGELTCPVEQRQRFLGDQQRRASEGLPVYPLDERFLAALDEGLPDCAGNALGLDRLVAAVLHVEDIADVMPFPLGEL